MTGLAMMPPDFDVNRWLAGALVTVAGGLGLWRAGSRARLDAKKDSAEGRVVDSVFRERDDATKEAKESLRRLHESERRADGLEFELRAVKNDLRRANEHIESLEKKLASVTAWLNENSGYVPLIDLPLPFEKRKK